MDDVTIRPAASPTTKAAPADWFTGTVLRDALATPPGASRTNATLVAVTPGAVQSTTVGRNVADAFLLCRKSYFF